jgi:hypothetical protein
MQDNCETLPISFYVPRLSWHGETVQFQVRVRDHSGHMRRMRRCFRRLRTAHDHEIRQLRRVQLSQHQLQSAGMQQFWGRALVNASSALEEQFPRSARNDNSTCRVNGVTVLSRYKPVGVALTALLSLMRKPSPYGLGFACNAPSALFLASAVGTARYASSNRPAR